MDRKNPVVKMTMSPVFFIGGEGEILPQSEVKVKVAGTWRRIDGWRWVIRSSQNTGSKTKEESE